MPKLCEIRQVSLQSYGSYKPQDRGDIGNQKTSHALEFMKT